MIYIPLPDEPSRMAIMNAVLRKSPVDPAVNRQYIATQTNGFSGADITEICNRAAKVAVREAIIREVEIRNKETEDHPDYDPNFVRPEDYDPVPMITVAHFEESMKYARRSVSDMEVRKYEAIAAQQHSRIGIDVDGRIGGGSGGGGGGIGGSGIAGSTAPVSGGDEGLYDEPGGDDDDDLYN